MTFNNLNRPLHHSTPVHHHIMWHTDTSTVPVTSCTASPHTHGLQMDCSITGSNSACIPSCTITCITSHIAHARTPDSGTDHTVLSLRALMRPSCVVRSSRSQPPYFIYPQLSRTPTPSPLPALSSPHSCVYQDSSPLPTRPQRPQQVPRALPPPFS